MENLGMFFFEGYFSSIMSIKSDAGKWRMVKAIYDYETKGILPDEKLQNSGIFRLIKALVDGRAEKKNKLQKEVGYVEENQIFDPKSPKDDSQNLEESSDEITRTRTHAFNKNKNENGSEKNNLNFSSPDDAGAGGERNYIPTISDIQKFVAKARIKNISPHIFKTYYDSKGWKIRGKPIENWRAVLIMWASKGISVVNKSKSFERSISQNELDSIFSDLNDIEF